MSEEKLGERALQAMKEMNTSVVEFKVPSAPRTKKGQMKILTEERYIEVSDKKFCEQFSFFLLLFEIINSISILSSTQELGKIIQKDFFPDLEKLKAQNAYLDAVERNDLIKLREIYAKYSGGRPNERVGCK